MNQELIKLLGEAAAFVIPGFLAIGWLLKNAVPSLPNGLIPLLTFIGGTAAMVVIVDQYANPAAWVASLIIAASVTGFHSGFKNTGQLMSVVKKDTPPPA